MHPESATLSFPIWSTAPFVMLLLSIAVVPLAAPHWWDKNLNKLLVSVVASVLTLAVVLPAAPHLLTHALSDYVSFMALIGALYVISGGIFIRGEFAGTPLVNTGFLAVGAVLANAIGTTGASMLLIRPYLRANHRRRRTAHLGVFFIFVVSNVGGLLTPLGDPPLFLGFLRGVPFAWTFSLLPIWLTAMAILLVVFNLYDQFVFNREDVETPGALTEDVQPRRKLHIEGAHNFLFLLGLMLSAVMSVYFAWPRGIQESSMVAMALLSWFLTRKSIHHANHFHFHPIAEVAALFAGIFVTMIPALEILNQRAPEMALHAPWHYFWLTGILSSFLDNAPTYLTFTAMASGTLGGSAENLLGLVQSPAGEVLMRAMSCGAVFMGANSYIGNGPNLMVKSIAERHGVAMPSFGGYMLFSAVVLIPLFIVLTLIFFR
jgi:Na+/H+ antiporter NhaD/arsenite permease-like protein